MEGVIVSVRWGGGVDTGGSKCVRMNTWGRGGGLEGEYGAHTCWRMDLGWGQLAERPPNNSCEGTWCDCSTGCSR